MRVVRVTNAGRRPGAARYRTTSGGTADIFIGASEGQTIVDSESRQLRLLEVTFKNGARNRLHAHSSDQILVITDGEGIVATPDEEHEVAVGDVAFVPANEPHWHGARAGRDMTHWAINGQPTETTIIE